jgi:hypothetical protein
MYNPKYLDTSIEITYSHGVLVTTVEQFDFICEHHPAVTVIANAETALSDHNQEVVIYTVVYGGKNYGDDTHITFDEIYKPPIWNLNLKEIVNV